MEKDKNIQDREYELNVINKKIKALSIPEQLQAELEKVD
jgi:hypothetical protein